MKSRGCPSAKDMLKRGAAMCKGRVRVDDSK